MRAASLAALAALALVACHRKEARVRPPVAVRVEAIAPTTQNGSARYSGTVLADRQVDLAFKAGGYVQQIASVKGDGKKKTRPLQAGDHVSRDMVLASLRREDFKQRYSELSAMSAEASAGYRKAKQDLDRAKQLFAEGAISQAEYDAARARFDGLAGSATAAAARAGQANLALSDSQLRSPLDGIVLDRRVEVGALVPPGAPVFVLADTSTVKVVFGVPDNVQRTLAQGQEVAIWAEAVPERTFTGVISKIAAQADAKTRAFDVEASIENGDGVLKVGMVTSIQLGRGNEGPTIQVPLSAIVRMPGDPQAFAVFALAGDVARARRVDLGDLVGNRVSVPRGLGAGDRIVVQGATLLEDGDAVNVVPGTGAIVGSATSAESRR